MSHHIYQTRAYVIESIDSGEANKRLLLLTEDLGLIYVAAQGVRLLKSKLKASIQEYSFSKVALVRGRETWRLTNALQLISLYDKRLPIEVRRTLVELLMFLKRLTPRDLQVTEVFMLVNTCASFCFEQKKTVSKYTEELGIFFAIRLLRLLGYGTIDAYTDYVCAASQVSVEILDYIKDSKKHLHTVVENALRESHL